MVPVYVARLVSSGFMGQKIGIYFPVGTHILVNVNLVSMNIFV